MKEQRQMRQDRKNKKIIKANRGITLIALVITIIVLLILAAVSIATLTGENGILTKASTAKNETTKASALEKVQIAVVGSFGNDGQISTSSVNDNLKNVEGLTEGYPISSLPATVIVDGYKIGIESSGKVSDTPTIPEGFYYAGGSIEEGFVISDVEGDDLDNTKQGNQFVWVPVPDMNDFHTIEGYSNGSPQSVLSSCSEPYTSGYATEVAEYNSMKTSVEENGGFYIGRFEAGKDSEGNVVVKKGATVYNNIGWSNSNDMTNEAGGAVEKAKNFTNGKSYADSVTSTLCYGVQWDATLQFIDNNYIKGECAEDSYVRNSTGKGNYNEEANTNSWKGNVTETGKLPEYAMKNIYDMAGNVWEWTMEAYNTIRRVFRGGNYISDGSRTPASYRSYNNPSSSYDTLGFRVALYL